MIELGSTTLVGDAPAPEVRAEHRIGANVSRFDGSRRTSRSGAREDDCRCARRRRRARRRPEQVWHAGPSILQLATLARQRSGMQRETLFTLLSGARRSPTSWCGATRPGRRATGSSRWPSPGTRTGMPGRPWRRPRPARRHRPGRSGGDPRQNDLVARSPTAARGCDATERQPRRVSSSGRTATPRASCSAPGSSPGRRR